MSAARRRGRTAPIAPAAAPDRRFAASAPSPPGEAEQTRVGVPAP